jgi:excisionase family DNA binding protein
MTTSTPRGPRFLAVCDVADLLKVSTKTVRRWIERGHLHVHKIGRQHRVSEEDLNIFLNNTRS